MPDTKITALTAISTVDPAVDVLPIVDVSDTTMAASGTTKKITSNQILGAGGTATLASATITGDLNVSGNGAFTGTGYAALQRALIPVGENGATSLDFRWYSTGTTYTTGARVYASSDAAWTASSTPARLMFSTVPSGSTSLSERYRIDNAGIHTWQNVGGVAGTAMTLNSTGLGVGISPSYKLNIGAANPTGGNIAQFYNNATSSLNGAYCLITQFGVQDWYMGQPAGVSAFTIGTGTTSKTEFFRIDGSGNVGIGVTPSAGSSFKVIQGGGGIVFGSQGIQSNFTENAYLAGAGTWTYATNAAASLYQQAGGTHTWYRTSAGTGNIAWTQAMTLDASGNLLVGKTANYGTGETQTLQLKSSVIFGSDNTGSASNRNWSIGTNASAAGSMEWTISSTNTGWPNFAYRMQLTSAGAAYNTTGTWGTISDSRLKENISDARNYLADLLKLRVVKYSLKEEASAVATKLGLIAQEVEQVFPSLVEQSDVAYEGGEGIRTVKTSILVPMLLKAIQELTARVQTLETR